MYDVIHGLETHFASSRLDRGKDVDLHVIFAMCDADRGRPFSVDVAQLVAIKSIVALGCPVTHSFANQLVTNVRGLHCPCTCLASGRTHTIVLRYCARSQSAISPTARLFPRCWENEMTRQVWPHAPCPCV